LKVTLEELKEDIKKGKIWEGLKWIHYF
jgi:hypothetical protein